jgi:hypothetical protein
MNEILVIGGILDLSLKPTLDRPNLNHRVANLVERATADATKRQTTLFLECAIVPVKPTLGYWRGVVLKRCRSQGRPPSRWLFSHDVAQIGYQSPHRTLGCLQLRGAVRRIRNIGTRSLTKPSL